MATMPASVLPLDSEQTNNLNVAVTGLTADQLTWVSGYVAGLAAAGDSLPSAVPTLQVDSDQVLTILYGSQTGNGEGVANDLARAAEATGFATKLVSLADFKPASLKREKFAVFVVSTHGEGDPPDDAELFREYLLSDKAPQLGDLKYSVLALGDSSYVNFCRTGREFDARLAELGAERLGEIVECDLDYEDAASAWVDSVVARLPSLIEQGDTPAVPHLRAVESASEWDKNNPFPAEVLVNQKITGGNSTKDVRHIELSLEGSGITYEPGDSLAVIVSNPPQLVEELIGELGLYGEVVVELKDETLRLSEALTGKLEITALNLGFLREWAEIADADDLRALLNAEDPGDLTDYVDTHQLIDVVRQFPAEVDAQTLVGLLRNLAPRSYSIASSLAANPDEVHLTVAPVRYEAFGTPHWGAASTHLADRVEEGDTVSVFVDRNTRFRLPAPDLPVIMIGPGTGVAPFRAFVEERVELGAAGDNWLFFGDRNFDSDFLYQLEWQRHLKQGNLARLDVAFSRDQGRKVYVQDRIRERGAEVWQWIENGAALYVCGDAKHMAPDVHEALVDVIETHGGLDREAAEQTLKSLRSDGRYQRDVY